MPFANKAYKAKDKRLALGTRLGFRKLLEMNAIWNDGNAIVWNTSAQLAGLLAPGSVGAVSQYSPNHFAVVAHILSAQTEQQLVVVGNSSQAKAIMPVLQVANENLYGNIYSLVEKTTLPELAAIIRQASLTIANNSVSMHFADVFGRPMVILHSESEMSNQWMPRNASARLLSRPAICSRCNQVECPNGINCLDVRPEEVAIAALEMLSEQTYDQTNYKDILGYKLESSSNEQSSSLS